jgi:hypothetical protein
MRRFERAGTAVVRMVAKQDTGAERISSAVQCRCGRSRHLESVACSRGSAR